MARTRINVTIDPEHLNRLDEYADRMGISRSAAICVLTAQALDGQAGIRALSKLADQMDMEEARTKGNAPPPSAPETGGL